VQYVEEAVHNRPQFAFRTTHHLLSHHAIVRPLGVAQIAGITQAAAVCRAAMFERPHRHPPIANRVPVKESLSIRPTQQLPGSALRKDEHLKVVSIQKEA
jgi:hypothetical protein